MDSEAGLILGMLAEGKIDTQQALGLLKALEESDAANDAIAQVEARAESKEPGRTASAEGAASQPAPQMAPEQISQRNEPSPWTRVPGPERIGEIVGSIGDIIASSVDKGIEVVTRLADHARHEAGHIHRKVKHLHIDRDIARPVKRLASAVKTGRSHSPSGAFSQAFSGWASELEGTHDSVPDVDSLEALADAIESLEDAAEELTSLLEHVDDSVQEACEAEDLDDMADAIERVSEGAEEALDQIAEVEQAMHEAFDRLDEIPGDKSWAVRLAALIDAWPGVVSELKPRLETAMGLEQGARATLREMIVSWAKIET
ncbi:MAG: hypothetical protein Q8P50_14095 [Bacillota bacterium]|nr:hypothetical protein [Bacillota bacterium]